MGFNDVSNEDFQCAPFFCQSVIVVTFVHVIPCPLISLIIMHLKKLVSIKLV